MVQPHNSTKSKHFAREINQSLSVSRIQLIHKNNKLNETKRVVLFVCTFSSSIYRTALQAQNPYPIILPSESNLISSHYLLLKLQSSLLYALQVKFPTGLLGFFSNILFLILCYCGLNIYFFSSMLISF